MKLCISEATTLPSTFAEDVAAYGDAGWNALEVWLTKLETHLETHSLAETRTLLGRPAPQPAAASYQGGLLLSRANSAGHTTIIFAAGSNCANNSAFPYCWSWPTSLKLSMARRWSVPSFR